MLSDKAYHHIFEALFKVAELESSAFSKPKHNPQKSGAESRLSACANVLRTLAQLGIAKLRSKTIEALLDHITQTLPNPRGGYREPLATDYFKALTTVLEHSAHAGHLSNEKWHKLVDFSIKATKALNASTSDVTVAPADGDEEASNDRVRLSRSATPSIRLASTTQRSNGTSSARQRKDGLGSPAEDIIACLKYLASTSNAPILEKAHLIVETMFYFLSTSTHSAPVQQAAFETVNAVLSRASTNDVSLTLRTVTELIPILKRHWSTKSPTLKEHMMVSLLLVEPYLSHVIVKYSEDEAMDLQNLIDVMRDEYCRRHDRDRLQVDDLDSVSMTTGSQRERPLSNPAMRLRFGLGKSESPWSLLYLSAVMTAALTRRLEALDDRLQDQHLAKRRKKEMPIDSVIRRLKLPGPADRLYALQMLYFLFDMVQLDSTVLQVSMETILQYVSDKNASSCSWAMLAILRLVTDSANVLIAYSYLLAALQEMLLHVVLALASFGSRYGELRHDI